MRDPAVDCEQFRREDVSVRWTFEALELLRNHVVQIDVYLLTYLLTGVR